MNGPSIHIHTDDDEDSVMDFSRPMGSFQIPRGAGAGAGIGGFGGAGSSGADLLINRRKVSSDVMSLASSDSGSYASGSDSGTTASASGSEDSYSDGGSGSGGTPMVRPGATGMFAGRPSGGSGSGNGATPANGNVMPSLDPKQDYLGARMSAERARAEQELNEKKEILYQMDRLESKGFKLPRKFNLQADLEEMRVEFNRILREKEVDASIRFQRKMMMALVTGVEFLNTRFDPFDLKLDGWSEQIHENLTDYDDIFEELHEKYKATGKKMAPELRLLMSLSGSAFMFHLTNSMFKQQPLPGVEQVLRANPDLMKQFQAAAANQMAGMAAGVSAVSMGANPSAPMPAPAPAPMGGGGGGMFGMIGNLFGSLGGNGMASAFQPMAAMQQTPPPSQPRMAQMEPMIQEVRARPPMNMPQVETMSAISDEEITSIIEDTADMVGLVSPGAGAKRRGRPPGSAGGSLKRTLDL